MSTISKILQKKGNNVWSVSPKDTVYKALEIMSEKNVGALIVIDSDGNIAGLFSERDYARKSALKGKDPQNTEVSELMSTKVLYVNPDQTIQECMALMTGKFVRHLPVVEGKQLVGIISIGDIVNKLISEQQFVIEEFEKYISGRLYGVQ